MHIVSLDYCFESRRNRLYRQRSGPEPNRNKRTCRSSFPLCVPLLPSSFLISPSPSMSEIHAGERVLVSNIDFGWLQRCRVFCCCFASTADFHGCRLACKYIR